MAGKLCFGEQLANAGAGRIDQSKSFCEGMAYRATGTLLGAPKTGNPHVPGAPDAIAWDLGWDFAETGKSASVPLDTSGTCCAAVGLVAL